MWSPQRPRCSCGYSSELSDRSRPQMGRCPSNCRGRVGEGKSWQGLEAEVKVKCNACSKGPERSGSLRMWGHQRLGKSGKEARVLIFLSGSHLRSSGREAVCFGSWLPVLSRTISVPPPVWLSHEEMYSLPSSCSGPPRTRKFPAK